jgi:hypothetical protein
MPNLQRIRWIDAASKEPVVRLLVQWWAAIELGVRCQPLRKAIASRLREDLQVRGDRLQPQSSHHGQRASKNRRLMVACAIPVNRESVRRNREEASHDYSQYEV